MNIIYKMILCFYMFFLILKSVFCSDGEGLYKTVSEENVYSDIFKALYYKNTHRDLLKKYPNKNLGSIIPCISHMVREKVQEVLIIDETSEELIRLSFFYKLFMTLLQCSGCKKSASSCRYCSLNKQVWKYFKVEGDAEHVCYDDNAMNKAVTFDVHKLQFDYLLEQFYYPERGKNTEKMNAAQLLFIEKNSPLNYFEKFCVKSKIDKMQKFGTYIMQGENIDVTNYKDLSTSDMLDVSDDVINSLIIDEFKEDGTHLLFPKMCEIFMAEKLFETAAKNDMSILKNTCYSIKRVLKTLKEWKGGDDFSEKSLQNMIEIVNNVRSEEMKKEIDEEDEEIDIDRILRSYEEQKEKIKQSNENPCMVNNINKNFKYLRCCCYALLVFICIVMIYKEKSVCEILAFPGVPALIGLLSDFYFNYHRARPVKIELSVPDKCLYDLYHRLIPFLGFGLKKFENVNETEQKKNFKNIKDILFGQEMKLRAWEYFDLDCGVWGSDAGQDKEASVEKYSASERFKNIYSFTSADYNDNKSDSQYQANFLNQEESDDTIKKNPDWKVLLCLEVLRAYNCFEAECSESEASKREFIKRCDAFFLEKHSFSKFIRWCNQKDGVCDTSQERVCSLHYKLKAEKEIRNKNYFVEEYQNKHASSQNCWVIGEKCVLEFKDGERGKYNKKYFYNYKNVTTYWKPECQKYCVFDDECHNMFVYLVHKNKAYIYTTFSDGTPMSDESVKKLLKFIFEKHMVTEIRAEYCNPNIFSDFYFMCGLENSISEYNVKKELDPEDSQIKKWPYSISVTYVISLKK